jgi:hypothetical protein
MRRRRAKTLPQSAPAQEINQIQPDPNSLLRTSRLKYFSVRQHSAIVSFPNNGFPRRGCSGSFSDFFRQPGGTRFGFGDCVTRPIRSHKRTTACALNRLMEYLRQSSGRRLSSGKRAQGVVVASAMVTAPQAVECEASAKGRRRRKRGERIASTGREGKHRHRQPGRHRRAECARIAPDGVPGSSVGGMPAPAATVACALPSAVAGDHFG